MDCRICQSEASEDCTVRNINIYVNGSEGLNICFSCEMRLVSHIRAMQEVAGIARLVAFKQMKKVREKGIQHE